jgi:hypothetical protein
LDAAPNTIAFLKAQKQKEKDLYIATTASERMKERLSDIASILTGYLGRETIGRGQGELYIHPNGKIRDINEDYRERRDFESEARNLELDEESKARKERLDEQQYGSTEKEIIQDEIHAFFRHWRQLLHNETRQPFDETTRYRNPNIECGLFYKDLYLAKRLIAPVEYEKLRSVMVGDYGDSGNSSLNGSTVSSDPETPLIVVSMQVRAGNWDLVSRVLDTFLSTKRETWQVFDAIYQEGTSFTLEGHTYTLQKGPNNERAIYCP